MLVVEQDRWLSVLEDVISGVNQDSATRGVVASQSIPTLVHVILKRVEQRSSCERLVA